MCRLREFGELSEAEYIVLRSLKIDAETIGYLKKARLIQRWGVGYDSVDIEAAGKAGIPVAVAAGVNAWAVSELAVLFMLSLYRHIVTFDNLLRRGVWDRESFIDRSFMIRGKTVGLVGCGNIGKLVARKVACFGANVIYYDKYRLSEKAERELGIVYCGLDELLSFPTS
jgi:D-3-phosphoglycerate dehydrogenase